MRAAGVAVETDDRLRLRRHLAPPRRELMPRHLQPVVLVLAAAAVRATATGRMPSRGSGRASATGVWRLGCGGRAAGSEELLRDAVAAEPREGGCVARHHRLARARGGGVGERGRGVDEEGVAPERVAVL